MILNNVGFDFAYAFDDIGNRVSTTANERTASYSTNAINQYTQRDHPGAVDVRGHAPEHVGVIVNSERTERTDGDFYAPATGDNSTTSVELDIAVKAVDPGPPELLAEESRTALLPQDPESFTYDLDGNLTQDGLWTYEWDAENRLVAMESRSDLPATVTRQRLEFAYDSRSRRIQKTVEEYDSGSSSWTIVAQIKFLYDGWNLLAEYDALNSDSLIRSHVWGLDLSATPQGVGGVGGLLWSGQSGANYAPGFDANGNIIAWVDLSDGSLAGIAENGAFGEPLLTSGISDQLPFGFSTKYEDVETGLLYYGYRYYLPNAGKWLSRDIIEEEGGLNLSAFVSNDGINQLDYLGQSSCGVLWRRSIDPKNNSLISDVVTWLLTPHWFIETEDGEVLDHAANSYGGRGGGQTDHWSATGFLILIGDEDCECFTQCLKREAENAGCYGLFTSNCGEAKNWINTCGGSW